MEEYAIIYHGGCPDGFGAAWAFWKTKPKPTTTYHRTHQKTTLPEAPDNRILYIMDTSFSRDQMTGLHEKHGVGRVILMDHHQTAEQELDGLPDCYFDQSRSGAVIAWEYFHPSTPVPELLDYIQDRDLWRWELPDSRAISAYIHSQRQDFNTWDQMANALRRQKTAREKIIAAGEAILLSENRNIRTVLSKSFLAQIAGYEIPIANSHLHRSEIGNALLRMHPDRPFVGIYRDTEPGVRKWSLRSRRGDFDVEPIARAMGGGGHPSSASFTQNTPTIQVP